LWPNMTGILKRLRSSNSMNRLRTTTIHNSPPTTMAGRVWPPREGRVNFMGRVQWRRFGQGDQYPGENTAAQILNTPQGFRATTTPIRAAG
jgi:hypothetical protein